MSSTERRIRRRNERPGADPPRVLVLVEEEDDFFSATSTATTAATFAKAFASKEAVCSISSAYYDTSPLFQFVSDTSMVNFSKLCHLWSCYEMMHVSGTSTRLRSPSWNLGVSELGHFDPSLLVWTALRGKTIELSGYVPLELRSKLGSKFLVWTLPKAVSGQQNFVRRSKGT